MLHGPELVKNKKNIWGTISETRIKLAEHKVRHRGSENKRKGFESVWVLSVLRDVGCLEFHVIVQVSLVFVWGFRVWSCEVFRVFGVSRCSGFSGCSVESFERPPLPRRGLPPVLPGGFERYLLR